MNNLKWIITPGHGYLQVPLAEFRANIKRAKLTAGSFSYSYRTTAHAYLEEDCEAGVYLEITNEQVDDSLYSEEFDDAKRNGGKFNGLKVQYM